MKTTILIQAGNEQILPYNCKLNHLFNIDNQYFALLESVTTDSNNQLVKQTNNGTIININTGLVAYSFTRNNTKVDLLRVKTDFKGYVLDLLSRSESEILKTCQSKEQINDITEISEYYAKQQLKAKNKPIVNELGKYKIKDTDLIEYNKELSNNTNPKEVLKDFKQWIKFINEVVLFLGCFIKVELLKEYDNTNLYAVHITHNKGAYKFELKLTNTMYFDFMRRCGLNPFEQNEPINEPKELVIEPHYEPPYIHEQNDIEVTPPCAKNTIHFEYPYLHEISDIQISINTNFNKLMNEIKPKVKLSKLDKLRDKLYELESKLHDAKLDRHKRMERMGWGYGMRHGKINISFIKEDKLTERIDKVKEQIKELNLCLT